MWARGLAVASGMAATPVSTGCCARQTRGFFQVRQFQVTWASSLLQARLMLSKGCVARVAPHAPSPHVVTNWRVLGGELQLEPKSLDHWIHVRLLCVLQATPYHRLIRVSIQRVYERPLTSSPSRVYTAASSGHSTITLAGGDRLEHRHRMLEESTPAAVCALTEGLMFPVQVDVYPRCFSTIMHSNLHARHFPAARASKQGGRSSILSDGSPRRP